MQYLRNKKRGFIIEDKAHLINGEYIYLSHNDHWLKLEDDQVHVLPFGLVNIENEETEEETFYISLNFDLDLGNNFTYQHFIDSIFEGMEEDNERELLVEFLSRIDLGSDLVLVSNNMKILNTCLYDFWDHARDLWKNHCKNTY